MNTHVLSLFIAIPCFALAAAGSARAQVWVNELHYDDTGTDAGEFVEVVAPASLTDLGSVRLTLYNGGDGKPYGSSHLLNSFTPGVTVSGLRFYSKLIPGLQNGAPDGLALDISGSVVQFVSYEGAFAASTGPAAGILSLDMGVSESDATAAGTSLGLVGTGSAAAAFTWAAGMLESPGAPNPGQSLIPEPRSYGFAAGIVLAGWLAWRRRRRLAA